MAGLSQQSSDVRFREIDLSESIRSQENLIGAIVLNSSRGRPTKHTIRDIAAFKKEYGIANAQVSMAHYCALDALAELGVIEVVRVVGAGAKWSAAMVSQTSGGATQILAVSSGITDPETVDLDTLVTGGATPLFAVVPKSGQGSYGNNLAVRIVSQNISAPTVVGAAGTGGSGTLSAGSYQYRVSAISEIGETLPSTAVTVSSVPANGSVKLTITPVEGARGYYVYGRTPGGIGRMAILNKNQVEFIDVGPASGVPDTTKIPAATAPTPTNIFTVQVWDTSADQAVMLEDWTATLQDFTDAQGVQLELTQRINPFSEYITVISAGSELLSLPTIKNTARVNLAGGTSGSAPTAGQRIQAWIDNFGSPEKSQARLFINAGDYDLTLQKTLVTMAEARGDAFAILDTPSSKQKAADAIGYRQLELAINSSYGALYTSDSLEEDLDNGKRLYIPLSGQAAAVIARTIRTSGPQFQPAGLKRGLLNGVLKLRHEYTESERTDLFNAQVNYSRKFLADGMALFEAVTLQTKQSATSWIGTRLLLNTLKVSIKQFLEYSLHDPNDPFLREQIVTTVQGYLDYWVGARALASAKVVALGPEEDPAKYNLGILTVNIFIEPIINAHEIQVNLVITKAGMNWSEINISNLG